MLSIARWLAFRRLVPMRTKMIARIGAVKSDNRVNCQQTKKARMMQASAFSGSWITLPPISLRPEAITFMSLVKWDISFGVPLSVTDW